ncbi:MAG: hypothetical protein LBK27_03035 [Treponema sp.]|nr:hypothetical protein [Treponema sp.]
MKNFIEKEQSMTHFRFAALLSLISVFTLGSCIGLQADLSIRKNGSGVMNLEYRVSKMAESLGRLDGNERWQTIPAGRADFERTMERLPGLRMVSFSSKNDGADIINRVRLAFDHTGALIPFLAGTGQGASFTEAEGKKQLTLILYPGVPDADPELLALVREISRTYRVSLSFSAPGATELAFTDGAGRPLAAPEGVELRRRGKTAAFSIDTGELLCSPEGLGLVFSWL